MVYLEKVYYSRSFFNSKFKETVKKFELSKIRIIQVNFN